MWHLVVWPCANIVSEIQFVHKDCTWGSWIANDRKQLLLIKDRNQGRSGELSARANKLFLLFYSAAQSVVLERVWLAKHGWRDPTDRGGHLDWYSHPCCPQQKKGDTQKWYQVAFSWMTAIWPKPNRCDPVAVRRILNKVVPGLVLEKE